jgi:hypothetical protein
MSWEIKLVPTTWNILMLNARRHVQDKDTQKIPPCVKVSYHKGKKFYKDFT